MTHRLAYYFPPSDVTNYSRILSLETCHLSLSQLLPTVYETTLFHWTCDPPYRQPLSCDRAITSPIQCSQLLCSERPVARLPYSQPLSLVKTVTNHMQCHRHKNRGRKPPPPNIFVGGQNSLLIDIITGTLGTTSNFHTLLLVTNLPSLHSLGVLKFCLKFLRADNLHRY